MLYGETGRCHVKCYWFKKITNQYKNNQISLQIYTETIRRKYKQLHGYKEKKLFLIAVEEVIHD